MDGQLDSQGGADDGSLDTPPLISPTAVAVLAASLASGSSRITHAAFEPATQTLMDGLRQLGVAILADKPAGRIEVAGQAGHWGHGDIEIDCGGQSSTTHLLLAACVSGRSRYRLMNPAAETASIASLIDALTDLGVQIHIDHDAPDRSIQIGPAPFRGGQTVIRNSRSSSAVATLLLIAPCAAGDVFLEIPPWPARPPEVGTALQTLDNCGIAVVDDQGTRMIVPAPQSHAACEHDISMWQGIR